MGWCGAGRRPRGAARGARRPWWRTCGPSAGPARAPAGRSSTAAAATRRDHVRPAITAGQRPSPDFWHPTGHPGSTLALVEDPNGAECSMNSARVCGRTRGTRVRPGVGSAPQCTGPWPPRYTMPSQPADMQWKGVGLVVRRGHLAGDLLRRTAGSGSGPGNRAPDRLHNTHRPDRTLSQRPPEGGTCRRSEAALQPLRRDGLGGLIHEYVLSHDVTEFSAPTGCSAATQPTPGRGRAPASTLPGRRRRWRPGQPAPRVASEGDHAATDSARCLIPSSIPRVSTK